MSKITRVPNNIANIGINLIAQDKFVNDHGIIFEHWSAIPSPIGLKDRGDIRRPESLDTFSSNGFIYRKAGEFVGVIMNNSNQNQKVDGAIYDNSSARMILPRSYTADSGGGEISFLVGDRIYAKDLQLNVGNYQRVTYSGVDKLQFPVSSVDFLIDSYGANYFQDINFTINHNGDICWVGINPGTDPETGKGNIYSIRYKYVAFWYISSLLSEVRMTNTGDGNNPERMPYQIAIQREYVYHNQVSAGQTLDHPTNNDKKRENPAPKEDSNEGSDIIVDMSNFKL